ncbi:MAG: hypothetical protein KGS72_25360 [Cyanobacteria bacterium REEB67]|nr:hypothetical protein [Cyanobacteria bacterium REEB67]
MDFSFSQKTMYDLDDHNRQLYKDTLYAYTMLVKETEFDYVFSFEKTTTAEMNILDALEKAGVVKGLSRTMSLNTDRGISVAVINSDWIPTKEREMFALRDKLSQKLLDQLAV